MSTESHNKNRVNVCVKIIYSLLLRVVHKSALRKAFTSKLIEPKSEKWFNGLLLF